MRFRRLALTRVLAAPLLLSLLTMGLAACGDDTGADAASGGGLDTVTIEGDIGSSPKVTFDGRVEVSKVETKTLITGDGPELGADDEVLAHLWIGNGFSQQKALDTYEEKKPELITINDQVGKVFRDAIEGQTVGSRVAVAAPAKDAFGEGGNPTLGIGNADSVIIVIDLVSDVLDGPHGTDKDAPDWTPEIVTKDDVPTGFDFSGTPEPSKRLRIAPLVQGDGATVKKGQTIVVDYLGEVYGGTAPFDESFSKTPASFQIGVGAVVKGWDQALVGRAVGSRVLLAIPPDLGYGDKGNKDAGIKGTDTLYFVVDILAAG
ncbi:FKBP-type peptidyl-prolyl cis-trans isomerase [Nocardioides islandensis]|uniref:Peptidyl-prolyl cis-trans isomerase n=1 Tax=Nocardioides islandensis TaxID=433663 RepID=A0A930YFU3_9ACTN|nr:FKBP-type peptidyl-prolyl cis-trans isomerase [Nocardioides islandensis]MBF4765193.1 FKBP-type peptidyl-prolyl cis-trans isomerase [Nocardioides islandensis]